MVPYSTTYLDYFVEEGNELWITTETFQWVFDSFEGLLGLAEVGAGHPNHRRDIRQWSSLDLEGYLQLKYFDTDLLDILFKVSALVSTPRTFLTRSWETPSEKTPRSLGIVFLSSFTQL